MSDRADTSVEELGGELDAQTVALRIIAGLLIAGAMSMLSTLLIPFFAALVVAIAMSPLANRLERLGLGRTISSLACLLLVAVVVASAAGMLAYQVGSIVQDSNEHLQRFSEILAQGTERVGGERLLKSMGYLQDEATNPPVPGQVEDGSSGEESSSGGESGQVEAASNPEDFWLGTLRRNASTLGRWLATGLGGFLGALGGLVVALAFLFYMLLTRSEWVDRLMRSIAALGLRPRTRAVERIQNQVVTYVGCLFLVSVSYVVLITLATWAIGLPQPLLWGALTGILELVPYFGPLVAGSLTTIIALSGGDSWWQPVAVASLFVALQTFEGYVVAPMLYGKAVDIDPVTVLVGVLFFGWLWGPLGLTLAMPMLIFLRGLVAISPDVPAIDALVDEEGAVP